MKNLKEYSINEGFLRKNLGLGSVKFLQEWLQENRLDDNLMFKINDNGSLDIDLTKGRFVTELFGSRYSSISKRFPENLTLGKITGSDKFKLVLKNPGELFDDMYKSKLITSIKCDNIYLDRCGFGSDTINEIFNNHKFTNFEITDNRLKNLKLTGDNNKLKTLNINHCPNLTNIDFDLNLSNKCVVKICSADHWSPDAGGLSDMVGKVKGCEKVFISCSNQTMIKQFGRDESADDIIIESDFFKNLLDVFVDVKQICIEKYIFVLDNNGKWKIAKTK